MKLREIEEKNLCPKCGTRLIFTKMPPRTDLTTYGFMVLQKAWHCRKCDKYFEEVKDENT